MYSITPEAALFLFPFVLTSLVLRFAVIFRGPTIECTCLSRYYYYIYVNVVINDFRLVRIVEAERARNHLAVTLGKMLARFQQGNRMERWEGIDVWRRLTGICRGIHSCDEKSEESRVISRWRKGVRPLKVNGSALIFIAPRDDSYPSSITNVIF